MQRLLQAERSVFSTVLDLNSSNSADLVGSLLQIGIVSLGLVDCLLSILASGVVLEIKWGYSCTEQHFEVFEASQIRNE